MSNLAAYIKWILDTPERRTMQTLPFNGAMVGSYSQNGEDLIIDAIFRGKDNIRYIDIGANDPVANNNTYRFYLRGCSGVNIDPNPFIWLDYQDSRPRDDFHPIGISDHDGRMKFYVTSDDTLSGFDRSKVMQNCARFGDGIISETDVTVRTLSSMFESYRKMGENEFDLLLVDTEGTELSVLSGNDWDTYRPKVVMAEMVWDVKRIMEFMYNHDYQLVFRNNENGIFVEAGRKQG